MLTIGHYYWLHSKDNGRSRTQPTMVMCGKEEVEPYNQYQMKIFIPESENRHIFNTRNLRQLGATLVEDGATVVFPTRKLESGIVSVKYPSNTVYYNIFRDLFLHPELVWDNGGDELKLKVIVRLVDKKGNWIAQL